MNPRIKQAVANNDFTFSIVFTNNVSGLFDMKPFLDKGKFKELVDINNFKRFYLDDGVINWYNDLDISPDTVYLLCRVVSESVHS